MGMLTDGSQRASTSHNSKQLLVKLNFVPRWHSLMVFYCVSLTQQCLKQFLVAMKFAELQPKKDDKRKDKDEKKKQKEAKKAEKAERKPEKEEKKGSKKEKKAKEEEEEDDDAAVLEPPRKDPFAHLPKR